MKKLLLLLLFIPLVSFGQEYYVSAKGGLNVREAPNSNSKKVAILLYGQNVTIESETGIKLTINDTDKKTGVTKDIEGEWVEITLGEKIRGYVFDGFLKGVKSGTDFYTLTIEGKSKIYDYNNYRVTVTDYLDIFERIEVYNKRETSKDPIQFKKHGVEQVIGVFGGVVENHMIIEDIESDFLYIYNLQSQQLVFSVNYINGTIKNSKIYFEGVVGNINEIDKPKCPQEWIDKKYIIEYIQEFIFDPNSEKKIGNGIYKCNFSGPGVG
jgi:hypothetical protein